MADLATLIAKDAIRDLCARYMRGQDRLDRELHLSTFWPDATTDYGIFKGGAEDFVDFAQDLLAGHLANQHLIGQTLIDVDGERAFGEVYYYAFHRIVEDGAPVDMVISGRYLDRYECRNGEWRFAHRSEFVDWVRKEPAADRCLTTDLAGVLRGRHDMQDRSYDRAWLETA